MDWNLVAKVRAGEFNQFCSCITTDMLPDIVQLVNTYSLPELREIWELCPCTCTAVPQAGGAGGGGGGTPPGPGSIEQSWKALTLPSSCGDFQSAICTGVIQTVMNGLCTVVRLLDPNKYTNKIAQGLVYFLRFACDMYAVACEDDQAAATFILAMYAIDQVVYEEGQIKLGNLGAAGAMLANLLGKMEAFEQQNSCWQDLVSANQVAYNSMLSAIHGGGL